MKRRFRSFHGLTFDASPVIQNGLERFDLPDFPIDTKRVEQLNQNMKIHAQNRPRLLREWTEALQKGVQITEEIQVPIHKTKRYEKEHQLLLDKAHFNLDFEFEVMVGAFYFRLLFSLAVMLILLSVPIVVFLKVCYLLAIIVVFLSMAYSHKVKEVIRIREMIKSLKHQFVSKNRLIGFGFLFTLLSVIFFSLKGGFAALTFVLVFLIMFLFWIGDQQFTVFNSWELLQAHNDTSSFFKKISKTVLLTLAEMKQIDSDIETMELQINENKDGSLNCVLKNSTPYEEHLFMDCLQELMNPIDNPRYLLALSSVTPDDDNKVYYALPTKIAKKKQFAELFLDNWAYEISEAELIYTRDINGRHELLKARGQSFSLDSHPEAIRASKWM